MTSGPPPLARVPRHAQQILGVGGTTLAVLIVALRIGLANIAPISDCDEVYNYWEPMHFLRFGT